MVCDRILDFLIHGDFHPNFRAEGSRYPALPFEVFPGYVIAFRANKRKHVPLAAILAHKRRGQAEPPDCLKLSRHAEYRRGQKVHFVINDEAPVFCRTPGKDLIRSHRYGFDVFAVAGIFADIVGGKIRLVEKLVDPLMHGRDVGREDERVGFKHRHDGHADDGFPRSAGKHDGTESGARAAVPDQGRSGL